MNFYFKLETEINKINRLLSKYKAHTKIISNKDNIEILVYKEYIISDIKKILKEANLKSKIYISLLLTDNFKKV